MKRKRSSQNASETPGLPGLTEGRSHPLRVRGLKRRYLIAASRAGSVAPFTGAWIETVRQNRAHTINIVAPFTGAWIETVMTQLSQALAAVAPFTGAWIETSGDDYSAAIAAGRTLYGCVD